MKKIRIKLDYNTNGESKHNASKSMIVKSEKCDDLGYQHVSEADNENISF